MKFLLVTLVVVVGLWLLLRPRRGAPLGRRPPPEAMPRQDGATDEIVACAHCGLHLPAGEALRAEGRPYCSEAHVQAGPRG